jgi:predicted O-methyltransferase YrrM
MRLHDIGVKCQTDKATNHHYCELYDLLFRKWRTKRVRLLEVGLQFGNSMRMWAEYFPYGDLVAVDLVDNGVKPEGFRFIIGNAYSDETLSRFNPPYDILIDDGSHVPSDQQYFIQSYLPMLRDDGIGVVEDVLSRDVVTALERVLPQGFQSTTVEMTKGASLVDSRLFIAWRS